MTPVEKRHAAEMGERIKIARDAQGLSQQQVGNAVEVTRAAVQTWEQGRFVPQEKHLGKLASVLKITMSYLVAGKGDDPSPLQDQIRPTTLRLRNMILEGRFDEIVHKRIDMLIESGELDAKLRQHGYHRARGNR
jgi:transcriptional regulator with XRE-family HTH domain